MYLNMCMCVWLCVCVHDMGTLEYISFYVVLNIFFLYFVWHGYYK